MCHLPRTAWQNVCTRPSGSIFTSSLWTNITPEVPIDVDSDAASDDAVAHRARPRSPRPRRRRRSRSTGPAFGGLPSELAGDLFRFVGLGEQVDVEFQCGEQLLGPLPLGHVQQQHAAGVADLGGVLAGQPAADFVLGQQDLGQPVEIPRLVVSQPEDLGGGEAGQGRVGHHLDQLLPAAGPLFDLVAFGRRPLVVPQDRPADDPLLSSRNTEPCIWPDRPMALTSAGLTLALRTADGTVRTVACHQSSGSCSLQSGLGW